MSAPVLYPRGASVTACGAIDTTLPAGMYEYVCDYAYVPAYNCTNACVNFNDHSCCSAWPHTSASTLFAAAQAIINAESWDSPPVAWALSLSSGLPCNYCDGSVPCVGFGGSTYTLTYNNVTLGYGAPGWHQSARNWTSSVFSAGPFSCTLPASIADFTPYTNTSGLYPSGCDCPGAPLPTTATYGYDRVVVTRMLWVSDSGGLAAFCESMRAAGVVSSCYQRPALPAGGRHELPAVTSPDGSGFANNYRAMWLGTTCTDCVCP